MRGQVPIAILPNQLAVERDGGLYGNAPILLKESRNIVPHFNSLRSIDGVGGTSLVQPVGTPPTDSNAIKIIFGFPSDLVGGNNTQYLCQSATRLSKYNNTTLLWNDLTGPNAPLTASIGSGVDWTTWWFNSNSRDGVITCNAKDKPIYWRIGDGSWTVLTNAVASRTLTAVADRIVIGNFSTAPGTGRPDRLRWSAFKDETTWPSLATADLLTIGDNIVSIRRIGRTQAVVYKDFSQWLMMAQAGSDAAAFRFELVDEAPGPLAVRAVAVVPGGEHYYLGNDINIYRFSGQRAQLVARTSYELELPGFGNLSTMDRFCQLVYLPKRDSLLCSLWPGGVATGFIYEIKTGRLVRLLHSSTVLFGGDPDITRDGFVFWNTNSATTGFSKAESFDAGSAGSDAINLELRIMLPIQAGIEYEVEGADLWFDKITPVVASANDFTLSIYWGRDVGNLTQSRLHTPSTVKLDNTSYFTGNLVDGIIRAAVVQFRLRCNNLKDVLLNIHRINIYAWTRRDLT